MAGILFVFDKSGSMSWGLDGNDQAPAGSRRIDYAKAALMEQLRCLPDQVPMGLILFPFSEPCDTAVVAGIGSGNKSQIAAVVSGVEAPWTPNEPASFAAGGTPLAGAINLAGQVAAQHGGGINIVVITDGQETCGGNPVAVAQQWRAQGIDVQFHVIGLVVDAPARQQLSAVAAAGGGRYYDAQNAAQLSSALGRAVQAHRRASQPGASGFFGRLGQWLLDTAVLGLLVWGGATLVRLIFVLVVKRPNILPLVIMNVVIAVVLALVPGLRFRGRATIGWPYAFVVSGTWLLVTFVLDYVLSRLAFDREYGQYLLRSLPLYILIVGIAAPVAWLVGGRRRT